MRDPTDKAIDYFQSNRQRMRYADFRRQGLFVGSGVIEAGKRADLLVLDANPLDDIHNIRRVRWTVIGGKLFDPNALWSAVDIQPVAALTK